MKRIPVLMALLLTTGLVFAQKKVTTSATISFDATTPKDGLPKAENKTVIGSVNTQTGDVAFEAAVKNFSFKNPKMQEHFNGENWFNSDKFPVITFKGKISKISAVKFNRNGVYKVTVAGEMKIKDVARKEKINGTITVKDGKFSIASSFKVKLADYNINAVPVEAGKVSKEPKVSVSAEF